VLPAQLTAENFKSYPPKARELAVKHLALLRQLPLSFAPFLLKEIISYDWKFPVEQAELDHQLAYLEQHPQVLARFQSLRLAPNADTFDWVHAPAQFLEQLSAHLWATHQIDEFRAASEQFIHQFYVSLPERPLPVARLGIVVIGQGAKQGGYPLFRKMRASGIYFTQVQPANGLAAILDAVKARAEAHPEPYAHWYIDGGTKAAALQNLTTVSYAALNPVRSALTEKMLTAYESPKFDPELLRSTLAQMSPESLNVPAWSGDAALERFELSLFTEGSGTQIYSTTFVQWAAREALRRAQPFTLLARYAPRQRERNMDELLSGVQHAAELDPHGSLVDADMGAYYTWLNQQRLSGAANSRFLVWFENGSEALVIAPGLKPASVNTSAIDISSLLQQYILKV
jgi:hypothetical protein